MTRNTILILVSALVSMVLGVAVTNKGECGAPEPTEEYLAVAEEMALNESKISLGDFYVIEDVDVPVYVHVVSLNKNEHPKNKDVRAMITNMNENYENMGFQFYLKNIDYTVQVDWASGKNGFAMKKQLRKGNYKTLNLYYVNTVLPSSTGTITGMCQYPQPGGKSGNTLISDGCVIRRDTLNNRQTTTHEVGHWLGLFHTFQGGCTGSGDMVADTPACQQAWSCSDELDTCPKLPGKDAVHNFMAYGNCRRQFTDGQAQRARSQYRYYRA